MRKLLMLGVCAFMSFAAFSQVEDEDGPAKPPTANGQTVYGELLGNAGLFSVNYDFRFTKKNKGIGMRVGGGFIGGSGGGILLLPVGINYLSGRASNYFEAGLGYTFVTSTEFDLFDSEGSGGLLVPNIGYRYQPRKKGFMGRIGLSPLIYPAGGEWIMWGYLAAGYRF